MNTDWIVVHDPAGKHLDGELVGAANAGALRSKGIELLPLDSSLLSDVGFGAFAKRTWGPGYPMEEVAGPHFTAPIAMYGKPSHQTLHWKMRLQRAEGLLPGVSGQISLGPAPMQAGVMQCSYSPREVPIEIHRLGSHDSKDGWTLEGTATVNIPGPGYFAFALYGMARGVRVAWLATSFT